MNVKMSSCLGFAHFHWIVSLIDRAAEHHSEQVTDVLTGLIPFRATLCKVQYLLVSSSSRNARINNNKTEDETNINVRGTLELNK